MNIINVRIADMKFGQQGEKLHTLVGSCLGVCLWDMKKRVGAMIHIMLPESKLQIKNKYKYADTGIPAMIDEMLNKGSSIQNIVAKLAGGANIFNTKIGDNNIEASQAILKKYGIPIAGESLGGPKGRNIDFYIDTGKVIVRKIKESPVEI